MRAVDERKEGKREREREIPRHGRIFKTDTAFAAKLQYNARPMRKAEFIAARLHA